MKIIRPMTPLRKRMLEDMQIRNYSPHTIDGYLRSVGQFAKHFGVSPDQLGAEHIRAYQLHLLQKKASKSIFTQTVCALRFLYETTLGRPWPVWTYAAFNFFSGMRRCVRPVSTSTSLIPPSSPPRGPLAP